MSEEEFTRFVQILQENLPVTFRVNQTEVAHQTVCTMFADPDFVTQHYKS